MRKVVPVILFLVTLLQYTCVKNEESHPVVSARVDEYKDPFPIPEDAQKRNVTGFYGGRIISATLSDIGSFNTLVSADEVAQMLNQLMNPGLTEMNLITQEPEPGLAKDWLISNDKLTWTFHLRKGLKWSDGVPFSADDVIFTMQVINDPKIPSGARDALLSGAIQWTKVDDYTVQARLPSGFVPFLRQIDGATAAILPKHKWESAYKSGKFEEAMQVSMDLKDYACLGPFRPKEYKAGQRLTLERNPQYWRIDKNGKRLPYLDEITFLIIPTQDQLFLKMQSGEIDTFYNIRAEDVENFKVKAATVGMKLLNLGPSNDQEGLWFNMNGDRNPKTGKPYMDQVKRSWFVDDNFRKAVSYGLNRNALVRNALFEKGVVSWGPESVGNIKWYNPHIIKYEYDPAKSVELLKASGFTQKTDASGKLLLQDKHGNQVRFSLSTIAGNSISDAKCNLIVSDLGKLGMQVEYTPLDFNTLVTRITESFDYDSMLLGMSHDDLDPTNCSNMWPSSGSLHFWWPNEKKPAFDWEKRVDELMKLQESTFDQAERKKYYDEVQLVLTEHQPMIFTTTQYVYICAKNKIGNLRPSVSRHRTLWNAYELYWMP